MANNNNNIKSLTIREFLSNDKYLIPIYQRNYDWGEKEALQLIEDIADYAKEHPDANYYIGSAVVFPKVKNGEKIFETIDGQQRLTTLTILSIYLSDDKLNTDINLTYDHRKEAEDTLINLNSENIEYSVHPSAQNIVDVYNIFKKNVPEILRDKGIEKKQFSNYLFNNVIIVRVCVPDDTDLNHYFEIMNTRGEQLEMHEVLKANLMSHLEKNELHLFNLIWEACSDMYSYVQMGFIMNYRNVIFTEQWDELQEKKFDKIRENIEKNNSIDSSDELISIKQLIDNAHNERYELPTDVNTNDKEEHFEAIINFPNFLLQVLKIVCLKKYVNLQNVDVKLDDKKLIQTFKRVIESFELDSEKKEFVRDFIVQLLKLRMLFDKYVIKREYLKDVEKWSLKKLKKSNGNSAYYASSFPKENDEDEDDIGRDIRMLESMFHVSAPTQTYKHWLNAVLYQLYDCPNIDSKTLRDRLYLLATKYMSHVYLADNRSSFEDLIYKNNSETIETCNSLNFSLIHRGCNVPNFVFNFYDYITWKENIAKYPKFEFTYRTSVEHFYPQKPMQGNASLKVDVLDNFGNLCLISRSMNSRFGNNMPKAKLADFGSADEIRNGLSLKLLEMMEMIVKEHDWDKDQIEKFGRNAEEKLHKAIENGI